MSRSRHSTRTALGLAAALLALAGCGSSGPGDQADDTSPARLPDVTLEALGQGDAVDLGALRGPAVVNLWASWCGPCKRELPIYQDFFTQHGERVAVLGVDWQETATREAATMAASTDYPQVVDADGEIPGQALPQLLLIDERGRIAHQAYVEITSLGQLETLVADELGVAL